MEDTVGDPIFQHNGAKIHTARDTMAWFARNNIQVMEWPPNSLDLNPKVLLEVIEGKATPALSQHSQD